MPRSETGVTRIDLRKEFPMSHRWALKKSMPLLLAFVAISIVAFGLNMTFISDLEDDFFRRTMQVGLLTLMAGAFLIWLARFLIFELEHHCYYYGVESGHFVFSKGIFLKQRASFPLSRITDIYVDRSLADFIFCLYSLHVSTPTVHSGEFARILGLNKKNADGLQRRLSEMVEEGDYHIENIDNFVSTFADTARASTGGARSTRARRSPATRQRQAPRENRLVVSQGERTHDRISSSRKNSRY
jgi:membrane protein YdbS with pleckstrin-like domain